VAAIALAALALSTACSKSSTSGGGTPSASGSGLTKDATIAAELPSAIASAGVLKVASDASYPPNEYFAPDNKTIIGFDVEIANAVGQVLGVKVQFTNVKFDDIIPSLQAGKYDVGISGFTDNKDREQKVDMVDYLQAGESIFVLASSGANYTSPDQLCGKSASVEKGTTELDDLNAANTKCSAAGKPKINILPFDDQNGANLALTSGHADACLADSQVADYAVKVTNGKVKVTAEYMAPNPYGIAVPRGTGAPGSAPLAKAIKDALQKVFDSGVYLQILNKYGISKGAIAAPGINGAKS
jgi:polar amino acid transport system substrate-binding protein